MERVRHLFLSFGLPKKFWRGATDTATYLINRYASTARGNKTPMELWDRKQPDFSHLRVFGCKVYAYTRGDRLEPRALTCVLAYLKGLKGYKFSCYEPGVKKGYCE